LSEENLALHKRIAELEATPPQREWVGLTNDEIAEIYVKHRDMDDYARLIEAKLKEKNHIADAGKKVALEKENAEIKKQLEQTAMALNEQVELNKHLEKNANTTRMS
jgi:hypothetical protein